jgi:hypothetical protein
MGFLKMMTSLHPRLAVETHLGDGEFLPVTEHVESSYYYEEEPEYQ